jgi:predicted GNAT family acetyltransferase
MKSDEVEASIKTKAWSKVRFHHLEVRVGNSVAFLSYAIDDENKTTIRHSEIPPSLQRAGIGGKLVEEAVRLAALCSPHLVPVREGTSRAPSRTQGTLAVAVQASLVDNESRKEVRPRPVGS